MANHERLSQFNSSSRPQGSDAVGGRRAPFSAALLAALTLLGAAAAPTPESGASERALTVPNNYGFPTTTNTPWPPVGPRMLFDTPQAGTGESESEGLGGPLKLALWTDRTGYHPGGKLRLYRTIDPRGLRDLYYGAEFFLERVGSDQRRYLAPRSNSDALRSERVDEHGLRPSTSRSGPLRRVERELTWQGEAPTEPGLWQFVMEHRKVGETGELQRVWAKFVVGPNRLLNRPGFEREVSSELTLAGGSVHYLQGRLVVRAGGTLRLEPGSMVQAWSKHAEIVVDPGGRIEAAGTREAPVVLTCTQNFVQREPGCWAGLRLHGRAPVTGGDGGYGGTDPDDSSGSLRYVRIEFAGASPEEGVYAPALALRGVGSGTVLEHVQTRSSAGDGISFVGGTVGCDHCVASDSGGDGVSWQGGWRGRLRHLYVWQGHGSGDALNGRNLAFGPDREPRSHPDLAYVTLATGGSGALSSGMAGLYLYAGTALTARQLVVHGYRGAAILSDPRSGQLFEDGLSSVTDSVQSFNPRPVRGWSGVGASFLSRMVRLRNAGTDPNHDPRPENLLEAQASPPGEADYIGAFGSENWLEEWTVFGLDDLYTQ